MSAPAALLAAALAVPFVAQEKDTCAAASLAMVMRYWGQPVSQGEITAALMKGDGARGGSQQTQQPGIVGSHLAEFARSRGLTAIAYEGDLPQLRDYVSKGRPLIVAWQVGRDKYHDVVVVGFEDARGEVVVHDPAEGAGRRVNEKTFEKRWAGAGHWTLLVVPQP